MVRLVSSARAALSLAIGALLGCASHSTVRVTPWLREVRWENETVIAESGRGRGRYLERVDPRGRTVRVEGWGCEPVAHGEAALCSTPRGDASFLLWRSGARRTIACGGSHLDSRARLTGGSAYGMARRSGDHEILCVEEYYAPVYVVVRTRQDLHGRELERSEAPMTRAPAELPPDPESASNAAE